MCGIVGYLRLSDDGPPPDSAGESVDALRHRGPDDQGTWSDSRIFLGMRRLSIIDVAGGHQPICNEDQSCVIVYNGELYNYLDLRPELAAKGHSFHTRTDTEVVLHAYEEWGVDCLRRFNGMFALAIWNQKERTLFLARDRVGEKPLYYYQDSERLVFASEIKALLANPTIPRQLNPRGLVNFMAFGHAVAPETIYQGIHKLLPGHYLTAKDGQIRISQYWDVGQDSQPSNATSFSEDEYAEQILSLLDDSVRRRMIADVPLGAFLSGGVDSSAVVALMKRHATGPVKTFSLGFALGGAYNELDDARRVARHFGTEHSELRLEHVDLIETLRTLVYYYDEPFGDAASLPVYLLSRFAREHVKVVLTGDGGDELFGGYRRYAADSMALAYQRLPEVLTGGLIPRVVDRLSRLRRIKRSVQALPIEDPAARYAAWLLVFTPEMQAELLKTDIQTAVGNYDLLWPYRRFYPALNGNTASDHLNRLMYTDLKTLMVDGYLEKTDKATMACSLEARLPLLDHRLIQLAFQIPGKHKIKGWSTKRIFKHAVRQLIPQDVLRRRKHGFAVPTDPWFRGKLKDFAFGILFDERTRQRGYFNMDFIERLWREHLEGRNVWDTHLWLLLNFELWHRLYLDGESV
jgi:asparagine synthase (glutamine-hydrolysing)